MHAATPTAISIWPLLLAGPSHGILTWPFETILYTPHPGYVGTDQIVFAVEDDRGALSNESTLTITVGHEQPPRASPLRPLRPGSRPTTARRP